LATDYCVKLSALDAAQLGFKVHLVEDACRGINLHPHDVEEALRQMEHAGVRRVRSGQLRFSSGVLDPKNSCKE